MADGNPFQSTLNPNAARTGLWDLRMMSAANRMETPFERGARTSYGSHISSNPMLASMVGMAHEPDYSSFTYDPQMRAQAQAAGVNPLEASQVKQNALLPNTGFFGNHPRLSAALEGGIFGGLAAHGGMTAGESIQGALEGMVGGQQMRQGLLRQQFARPFEAAGMIEGLRDMGQKRQLQEADIQHLRALNEHYVRGDDEKATALENTQRHQEILEGLGYQKSDLAERHQMEINRHDEAMESLREQARQRTAAGAGPWYSTTKDGKTTYNRVHEGQTTPEGSHLLQGDYQQKREDKADDARLNFINKTRTPGQMRAILGDNWRKMKPEERAKAFGDAYDKERNVSGDYDPTTGEVHPR